MEEYRAAARAFREYRAPRERLGKRPRDFGDGEGLLRDFVGDGFQDLLDEIDRYKKRHGPECMMPC
ncbi:MAG: hypothetical protein MPJ08_05865 [Nitrosopumilus sp.]|nr:hypothetical protein [Nitrosopumilus sp.]